MKRLSMTLRAYGRVSSLDQDLALQDIVHELKGRKRGAESRRAVGGYQLNSW